MQRVSRLKKCDGKIKKQIGKIQDRINKGQRQTRPLFLFFFYAKRFRSQNTGGLCALYRRSRSETVVGSPSKTGQHNDDIIGGVERNMFA